MSESVLAADELDHEYDDAMPQRSRARYLTPLTALLMALILGGVGFYVGIRVEKSKASSGGGDRRSPERSRAPVAPRAVPAAPLARARPRVAQALEGQGPRASRRALGQAASRAVPAAPRSARFRASRATPST